jgi:hypothetical protein
MTTATSTHLAGTCRATGTTRHAVETHRPADELDGAPELALCGAVVRVSSTPWDGGADDACPACGR